MTSKPRSHKKNIWFTRPVRERRGFALAVFFIFAPIGPLSSLMAVADPPWPLWYVALQTIASGTMAAMIVMTMHRFALLMFTIIIFSASTFGLGLVKRKMMVSSNTHTPIMTISDGQIAIADVERYRRTAQSAAQRDGVIAIAMIAIGYTFFVRVIGKEWENRATRDAEMQIAKRIQTSLTPVGSRQIPGFEILGVTQPANEVAGDYFDYLDLGENKFGVLIADAAGHGVAAGLLTAMLKGALALIADEDKTPEAVMAELNRTVYRLAPRNMFVTACYVMLDKRTRDIAYVTAGHEPLMLIKYDDRKVIQLRTSGIALGLQVETSFQSQHTSMAAGDTLLLYTDGLVETENAAGEEFGISRLEALLHSTPATSPQEFSDRILSEIAAHRNKNSQADDISLVIIRRATNLSIS